MSPHATRMNVHQGTVECVPNPMDYFVVLQTGEETVYPEVHYVFSDDAFHPEADAAERGPLDVSVLVDIDSTGQGIANCQSISPHWQATSATIHQQALGNHSNSPNNISQLIKLEGINAKENTEISSLGGSPQTQAATGLALVDQLERRREEVRRALGAIDNAK